jgi:hypothetical protein
MRPLPAFLCLALPTLILVACSGDQPATTAPSTTPSFFKSGTSYTFSLSCTDAGTSTVANVLIIVSPTVSGELAPLSCGGSDPNISGFKSFDYHINVFNAGNALAVQCQNTQPIHKVGSITCGTDPSATLTITPS